MIPYKGEGHGHTHYLNIKAKDGLKAYLENRLPAIQGGYQVGEFDKAQVLARVREVAAEAERLFGASQPRKLHRISQVLSDFEIRLNELATNSTQGYLEMLANFRRVYLLEQAAPKPLAELDQLYNRLIDQVRLSHIQVTHIDKMDLVDQINSAVQDKNTAELYTLKHQLDEIQRFDNTRIPTAIQYLDFFIKYVDSPVISNDLREQVAKNMGEIYRILDRKNREGEGYADLVKGWVETKISIDIAKVKREDYTHVNGEQYNELVTDPHILATIKEFIKTFEEDFKYIGSIKTPDEVVEKYGKPLTKEEEAALLPKEPDQPDHEEKPDQPTESDEDEQADTPKEITGTPWTEADKLALLNKSYDVQDQISASFAEHDPDKEGAYIAQLWEFLIPIQVNQGKDLSLEDLHKIAAQIDQFAAEIFAAEPAPLPLPDESTQPTPETEEAVEPAPAPEEPAPVTVERPSEAEIQALLNRIHSLQMQIYEVYESDEAKQIELVSILHGFLAPVINSNYGANLTKADLEAMIANVEAFAQSHGLN